MPGKDRKREAHLSAEGFRRSKAKALKSFDVCQGTASAVP